MTPPGRSARLYRARSVESRGVPACYTANVSVRRLLAAAIVVICIGVPLVESFDTWDQPGQGANDTEANVVFAALCVGLALTAGTAIVIARGESLAVDRRFRLTLPSSAGRFAAFCPAAPRPTVSPPLTALRI